MTITRYAALLGAVLLAGCGEPMPKEPCELQKLTVYTQSDSGGWYGPSTWTVCIVKQEKIQSAIR